MSIGVASGALGFQSRDGTRLAVLDDKDSANQDITRLSGEEPTTLNPCNLYSHAIHLAPAVPLLDHSEDDSSGGHVSLWKREVLDPCSDPENRLLWSSLVADHTVSKSASPLSSAKP